jgi:hypothetical protein
MIIVLPAGPDITLSRLRDSLLYPVWCNGVLAILGEDCIPSTGVTPLILTRSYKANVTPGVLTLNAEYNSDSDLSPQP